MELKTNDEAQTLNEFLGVTKERVTEMIGDHSHAFAEYYNSLMRQGQDSRAELKLLKDIVIPCKSWEEAIYMVANIQNLKQYLAKTVQEVMKDTVKNIIEEIDSTD